jgi:hypothetical protein
VHTHDANIKYSCKSIRANIAWCSYAQSTLAGPPATMN